MAGLRRWLLILGASLLGVIVLLYVLAFFVMPKDWIQNQAMRMASHMQGGTVRWKHLTTGFSGLSLGAKLEGVTFRIPAQGEGESRAEGQVGEIFVRFKLIPLLFRRVEVEAASLSDAGLVMIERAQPPPREQVERARNSFSFHLPRLEFDGIDLQSTDLYGTGTHLRGLKGHADIEGFLSDPKSFVIQAEAESLSWKPSAGGRPVALPSPFRMDFDIAPSGGTSYRIRRGHVELGRYQSEVTGSVGKPAQNGDPYKLDLTITGKPQRLDSDEKAFRALTQASPATWNTVASWVIRVTGTSNAMVQNGRATLRPLHLASGSNRFTLGQVQAAWATTADRKLRLTAAGSGSGVQVSASASGSTEPGGATSGTFTARAPAARLNGVIPNMPSWSSGAVECRANFVLDPPAPPRVWWTILGSGLNGVVRGIQRPVTQLGFHIDGDMQNAWIRSMRATVGSSTASLTGSVRQGKPLGTGTFQASMNRFIAEEWAAPRGSGSVQGSAEAHPQAMPIPLRAFDAVVTIGEARSGRLLVRNLTAPVRFAGGNLVAAPITGDIGTGTINGRLDILNLEKAPAYKIKLEVKRAPVKELVSGILPVNLGFTGFANGFVDLSGAGLPGLAAANSLEGALSGSIEDGKVLETPTIAAFRRALGLVEGTPGAPNDLSFKALGYAARISKGRIILQKMSGAVGEDLMEMTGSAGFDRTLDLDLLLRVAADRVRPGTLLAKFATYARDEQGRLPIKVALTGTLSAPKFSVKPASTLEAAGKGLVKDIFQRALERALPDTTRKGARAESTQARDTTKAAPKPAAPNSPSRSDSIGEPFQKAKEALERIFKK